MEPLIKTLYDTRYVRREPGRKCGNELFRLVVARATTGLESKIWVGANRDRQDVKFLLSTGRRREAFGKGLFSERSTAHRRTSQNQRLTDLLLRGFSERVEAVSHEGQSKADYFRVALGLYRDARVWEGVKVGVLLFARSIKPQERSRLCLRRTRALWRWNGGRQRCGVSPRLCSRARQSRAGGGELVSTEKYRWEKSWGSWKKSLVR